jgi:hypothetical protein
MTQTGYRVLLVGAGQLGSRHLQGLALIDVPVIIDVVDPFEPSLRTAQDRYLEVPINSNVLATNFFTRLDQAPSDVDLCIVATNADVRFDIVKRLLDRCTVRNFLLEKVLFSRKDHYGIIGDLLRLRQIPTYVNCVRRLVPFYKELKDKLAGQSKIEFEFAGSNWGLGCNSIHMIDLFAFLTGDPDISFDQISLDKEVLQSKRAGFYEFTGTITGTSKNGHSIKMKSSKEPGPPDRLSIRAGSLVITVEESMGRASILGNGIPLGAEQIQVSIPYQSQLTGIVASEILKSGRCSLTRYEESARLHLPLLDVFIGHLRQVIGADYDFCPIT